MLLGRFSSLIPSLLSARLLLLPPHTQQGSCRTLSGAQWVLPCRSGSLGRFVVSPDRQVASRADSSAGSDGYNDTWTFSLEKTE